MPAHVGIFVSRHSMRDFLKVVIGWIELTPYNPLTFFVVWDDIIEKLAFDTGSRAGSEHAESSRSLSTDCSALMIKSFHTICRRQFQGIPFI